MIAVLSPESLASNQVMDEISFFLEEEKRVIPVIIEACEVPFRLRRLHHVDFTDQYDMGFSQLLRALHIELPSPPPEPPGTETPIPTDQTAFPEDLPQEAPLSGVGQEETIYAKTPTPRKVESPPVTKPAEPEAVTGHKTANQRLIGALVGYAAGTFFNIILAMIFFGFSSGTVIYNWEFSLLYTLLWTIPGALCGRDKLLIKTTAIGYLVGGISGGIIAVLLGPGSLWEVFTIDVYGYGFFWLGPIGALIGVLSGVILKKRRTTS